MLRGKKQKQSDWNRHFNDVLKSFDKPLCFGLQWAHRLSNQVARLVISNPNASFNANHKPKAHSRSINRNHVGHIYGSVSEMQNKLHKDLCS